MESFREFKKRALKDKKVLREYKKLEPEFALARALIEKRIERGLTQAALARKIGTRQSAVARLESGTYNTTVKQLEKIAHALDSELLITIS